MGSIHTHLICKETTRTLHRIQVLPGPRSRRPQISLLTCISIHIKPHPSYLHKGTDTSLHLRRSLATQSIRASTILNNTTSLLRPCRHSSAFLHHKRPLPWPQQQHQVKGTVMSLRPPWLTALHGIRHVWVACLSRMSARPDHRSR